jgi:hypothetical protein
MKIDLQKTGGGAALMEALAYIVGFAVMLTILDPGNASSLAPAQKLAFILGKLPIFQAWNLFIYVVFGVFLVVLVIALHARLSPASAITRSATAFGLIWAGMVIAAGMIANVGLASVARIHAIDPAQALTVWQAVSAVQEGIGGGVEVVGGLWLMLISWAALQASGLPKALNCLGLLVGAAGVATVVPPWADLGAVFGLGQIVWFSWVGVVMMSNAKQGPSLRAAG